MTQSKPLSVQTLPVEDVAAKVMREVRDSLDRLLDQLPDSIRRAVDLERSLRIEKKLAWQVFRLSRSESLAEIANVPSLASVTRLIDAARKSGVPEPVTRRVFDAFEVFEDFAEQHGGTRAGLVAIVCGANHGKSEQHDMQVRRTLFRANAAFWGLQAEIQTRTSIIYQPASAALPRELLVAGNVGVQRLRQGSPVTMSAWARKALIGDRQQTPGELNASLDEGELLTEFCTQPLPQMLPRASVGGALEMEMVLPSAGRAGAASIYSIHVTNDALDMNETDQAYRMMITVPTQEVVQDIMFPIGWTNPSTARVAVYGRRNSPDHVFEERAIDLVPQRETISYLGSLENIPPIDGAPRHHDAVRHVLGRVGVLGMKFDVYRCRVQYPVLHTLIAIHLESVRNDRHRPNP